MKMTDIKKKLSFILFVVLIAAMALFTVGCDGNSNTGADTTPVTTTAASADSNVLGEGDTQFTFTVTDADGVETAFEIRTDKETVGDALLELGLIDGEEESYGLYVKTVNGITVDFDTDGKYWAFYINGEYAMTGVDATSIEAGATYSFKVE